jgi:Fe-S cluster assembly scaffold protein SufB
MNSRLNKIPMETWKHLNVNYADKEFNLPPLEGRRNGPLPTWASDLVSSVGAGFDREVMMHADRVNELTVSANEDRGIVTEVYREGHIIHDSIEVKDKGKVTLIQLLDGIKDSDVAALTQIRAGKDSEVDLVFVDLCDDLSSVWSAVSVVTEEGAQVNMVRIAFGCKTSLYGVRADLKGDGSSFDIDTGYFGDKDRILDFNDVSNFYGKETRSFINSVGVLTGSAKKVLRDTVDFKRGSVHAVGHEKEDVVMFSDDVINLTTPLILCGEEWVEGQHAATTTRLDDRVMYYLRSRGLTEMQARRLVIGSKYAPVIDKIPDNKLREDVYSALMRRIDDNERDH